MRSAMVPPALRAGAAIEHELAPLQLALLGLELVALDGRCPSIFSVTTATSSNASGVCCVNSSEPAS